MGRGRQREWVMVNGSRGGKAGGRSESMEEGKEARRDNNENTKPEKFL